MPKLLHAPVGLPRVAEAEGRREGGKERKREKVRESVVGKISFSPPKTFSVGAIPRNEREREWERRVGMAEGKLREGKTK